MSNSEPVRLTRAQIRELDRRAIEDYHIPGIVLMENAARGVAGAAQRLRRGFDDRSAVIVCGGGNNGGDGLAVARHLHNAGWSVDLLIATEKPYSGDALINDQIVSAMKLRRWSPEEAAEVLNPFARYFIIDALFGTGLSRPPQQPQRTMIEMINASALPILAIDVPSGIDCDSGEPLEVCVKATATVTFVAEKTGFANPASKQYTGEVMVADIGAPRELIEIVRAHRGTSGTG